MIQESIFQNIETSLKQLPQSLQVEVFHYVEFLRTNYFKQNNITAKKQPRKRDGFGIWHGKISISKDFNAPMKEFEEYM